MLGAEKMPRESGVHEVISCIPSVPRQAAGMAAAIAGVRQDVLLGLNSLFPPLVSGSLWAHGVSWVMKHPHGTAGEDPS